MQSFTIPADKLYYASKQAFFALVPHCEVNFVDGWFQMFFDLRKVAAQQNSKVKRREIAALVLSKCSKEHIERFTKWLSDYFSESMQLEIFDLAVEDDGTIIPGKMLKEALKKYRKR